MIEKEMIEYIISHCKGYFLSTEAKALRRFDLRDPVNPNFSFLEDQWKLDKLYGLKSRKVKALVRLGKDALEEKIALRVYQQYKDKILNLCPRCGKLARTPCARQCRYCRFDWH